MKDAKTYFVDENYNCAEAILRLANDHFELGLDEENMKLLAGFGGGMGCGKTCGALCGSIAALGSLLVQTKAHETPGFRKACAGFVGLFEEKTGSTDCAKLKQKYSRPEVRCLDLVKLTDGLLQEYAAKLQAQ